MVWWTYHKPLTECNYIRLRLPSDIASGKTVAVAEACNHLNCLVLPFRFPMVRTAAWTATSAVTALKIWGSSRRTGGYC